MKPSHSRLPAPRSRNAIRRHLPYILPLAVLALAAPECKDQPGPVSFAACPNEIPVEGAPCPEPGLTCPYTDLSGCEPYFEAICGADGLWQLDRQCTGGGAGGGGGSTSSTSSSGGGAGGSGGEGPCVDPVEGPPTVVSETAVIYPADTVTGKYRLQFSETVKSVSPNLTWIGPGQIEGVSSVGSQLFTVSFSGLAPGEAAQLEVGTGVRDSCDTYLDSPVTIDLSLFEHCHYFGEDFEGDFLSTGWTTVDNAGDGNVWARNDQLQTGVSNHTGGSGYCATANDELTGAASDWNATLRSPAIDLSGATDVLLSYQSDFQDHLGAGQAWLEVSANGTSWSPLTSWTESHGPTLEAVDISTFAGQSVYLRWRYSDNNGAGYWWDVDEVCVEEYTKVSCQCPLDGYTELTDVDGVSNGNGTLGTAEPTYITLAAVGDELTVCGLLEDTLTSGPDYYSFQVLSGSPAGIYSVAVSYCIQNYFDDARIQIWSKTESTPVAVVDATEPEGSFDVTLQGGDYYVSLQSLQTSYAPAIYTVSLEVSGMLTSILTEGFEMWPPLSLTPTDDDICLDWWQSWETVVPAGEPPTEGYYLAYFNSYDCTTGSESLESGPLSLAASTAAYLFFDMFHDPGYMSSLDTIQVQYDDGINGWLDIGPPFVRPDAVQEWRTEAVDLTPLAGLASVRIRLFATTAYGNNVHIDNVVLLAD